MRRFFMYKMRKRRKMQIPDVWKKVPGDHILRFYKDAKSGHPFLGISEFGKKIYGHEMTSHPALNAGGEAKKKYQRFHKNPNPNNKSNSYYSKKMKRLINTNNKYGLRLKLQKHWRIINRDLKILKNIDKKKTKNVRRADH